MRKYILIFLMLLSCTPASVHQAKLLRMRVGSAYGDLWEIRQLQDRMTGEHTLYAASPLVFAEGRDLISYMSVECGTTIDYLCLLALSFPSIEQNSQVSDDPISFRVRFNSSEPERFNFIRTQKFILLHPKGASRFIEKLILSRKVLIEVDVEGRYIYYNYPLVGAWAAIKKIDPKVSPAMFEGYIFKDSSN